MRLQGHKRAVTALCFDSGADTLVSGSKDTSIVVWDLTSQAGICRLRGHRDEVTSLLLVPGEQASSTLISSSKDTLLKVWDVDGQTCVQTLVGHRSEVWAAALAPAIGAAPASDDALRPGKRGRPGENAVTDAINQETAPFRVLTGCSDSSLRAFAVRTRAAAEAAAKVAAAVDAQAARGSGDVADMVASASEPLFLDPLGSITRLDGSRCQGVVVSRDGRWAAVFGRGKSVELYEARDWAGVRRRTQRRRRRARERGRKAAREKEAVAAEAAAIDDDSDGDDGKATEVVDKRGRDEEDEEDEEDEAAKSNGTDGEGEGAAGGGDGSRGSDPETHPFAGDEWSLYAVIRCPHRARSVALLPSTALPAAGGASAATARSPPSLLVSTADNRLELHCVDGAEDKGTSMADGTVVAGSRQVGSVAAAGHRKDVRCIALGPDNALALTASNGQAKLWNVLSGDSLRTMRCGYALCCAFLPGGQHAVVGTKAGSVQVIDLASGDMVEEHESAHEGSVFSLDVRSDGSGLVTASADKTVKLWDLEAVVPSTAAATASSSRAVRPSLVHSRTLRMPDEVLAVRYSKHGAADASRRLLAVSLLDSTVKVFFEDTLKFFLSLYGHKLPVTSIDISADSTLIATASADKNVKLWGLDFGDCHKSLFAHDEAVTAVRFVGKTHLFFTAGKDGTVRHWDGDRFVPIHDCRGHTGSVWGLDVSADGRTVVSAGADRSVRVWRRSEEQVFLEEEREREAEGALENELASRVDDEDPFGEGVEDDTGEERRPAGAPGTIKAPEAVAVAGGSREGVVAADRLLDAVALAKRVREEWREFELDLESATRDLTPAQRSERSAARAAGETLPPMVVPPTAPLELLHRTPAEHVVAALKHIAPADREQAILLLPLDAALELLTALQVHIQRGVDVELCARYALFIVRLHLRQITATPRLHAQLSALREAMGERLGELRSLFGYTRAGLRFLHRAVAPVGGGFLAASGDAGSSSSLPSSSSASSSSSAGRRGRTGRFGRFRDAKLF